MATHEPAAGSYEPEWRLAFEAKTPAGTHVVFSGIVRIEAVGGSDSPGTTTSITLEVGPFLKSVTDVVPTVSPTCHQMFNPDEDDEQYWEVSGLVWDFREGLGPSSAWGRVILKFNVHVNGEHSRMLGVAYHVVLRSRDASVNTKLPPAHAQVPKMTS